MVGGRLMSVTAISWGQRDSHTEFTLNGGEILRLRLRMTRGERLAMTNGVEKNRVDPFLKSRKY